MEGIGLEQRITRLVINGHIPLPCSLMVATEFLGKHNTASLLLAVLMSPAMGETRSDGRGYPVVKHKPGSEGWGHEAAPVVRQQPPLRSAQRLVGTGVPRTARCLHYRTIPVVAIHLEDPHVIQHVC